MRNEALYYVFPMLEYLSYLKISDIEKNNASTEIITKITDFIINYLDNNIINLILKYIDNSLHISNKNNNIDIIVTNNKQIIKNNIKVNGKFYDLYIDYFNCNNISKHIDGLKTRICNNIVKHYTDYNKYYDEILFRYIFYIINPETSKYNLFNTYYVKNADQSRFIDLLSIFNNEEYYHKYMNFFIKKHMSDNNDTTLLLEHGFNGFNKCIENFSNILNNNDYCGQKVDSVITMTFDNILAIINSKNDINEIFNNIKENFNIVDDDYYEITKLFINCALEYKVFIKQIQKEWLNELCDIVSTKLSIITIDNFDRYIPYDNLIYFNKILFNINQQNTDLFYWSIKCIDVDSTIGLIDKNLETL